jgi:hypothetical protein
LRRFVQAAATRGPVAVLCWGEPPAEIVPPDGSGRVRVWDVSREAHRQCELYARALSRARACWGPCAMASFIAPFYGVETVALHNDDVAGELCYPEMHAAAAELGVRSFKTVKVSDAAPERLPI